MLSRAIVWAAIGFLLGAMPISPWLVRLATGDDIRRYGDGNPGGANAWRAGTWRLGLPAVLLDFAKAAVPVSLARFRVGITGPGLVAVALAPLLGHAFSPFLGFRGGKAVAATVGMWSGLTLWEAPTVLGICFALLTWLQSVDGWSVALGMLGLLLYLLLRRAGADLLAVWVLNFALLMWKHRAALRQPPRLRPRILRLLGRQR